MLAVGDADREVAAGLDVRKHGIAAALDPEGADAVTARIDGEQKLCAATDVLLRRLEIPACKDETGRRLVDHPASAAAGIERARRGEGRLASSVSMVLAWHEDPLTRRHGIRTSGASSPLDEAPLHERRSDPAEHCPAKLR